MSNNKEPGIMAHARACMRFYKYFSEQVKNCPDVVDAASQRCYRETLESMRCCGLIDGYDLEKFTLQIGGVEVDA